jgi:hypothetical protein
MIQASVKRVRSDFESIPRKYKDKLNQIMDDMLKVLVLSTPVRSGKLRDSIRLNKAVRGNSVGFTVTALPYFFYLDQGTKEHMVRPRKKKVLHWVESDQDYFSKGHVVSGIKAMHLLKKAKDLVLREVKNIK